MSNSDVKQITKYGFLQIFVSMFSSCAKKKGHERHRHS